MLGAAPKGPDEPVDYFSADFVSGLELFRSAGYSTRILYGDPEHPIDAQKDGLRAVTATYGQTPDAFTRETLKRELERIVREVRAGDEVMLVVADHGYPHAPGAPWPKSPEEARFSVLLGKPAGEAMFLDELTGARDRIEAKGGRVALILLTCSSAYAMPFGTDKTCVLSETGTDIGHGYFAKSFWKNAKPGMTLEQAFQVAKDGMDKPYDDPHSSGEAHPSACRDFVL